jgi:hypothetical protein
MARRDPVGIRLIMRLGRRTKNEADISSVPRVGFAGYVVGITSSIRSQ